ncbi:hypothetical protein AAG906_027288 [Vitis piasezkii]
MKNQALELHSPLPKSFKVCKERTTREEKAVKKTEDSSYSLLSHFWSTSRSPFSTFYMSFRSSRSQKSNASNGTQFEVEMKELHPLQADHSKLKEEICKVLRNHPFVVINFVDYSLNQGAPAGHESAETPIGHESNGAVAGDVVHAKLNTIAEEAMNFKSYVAEVSRGWDEPNARDMGRMTSQPNAKGEMYILNDGIDMKAKIATMERRLEKLDMTNMQPRQAISRNHCKLCLEMFGDCNTYNSNWRDHPNFSWKPQPPQDQEPDQPSQQSSSLEQAIANLKKIVGDFWKPRSHQCSNQSKNQNGESGKEVDLPTCKLEHKRTTEDSRQERIDEETHASTFSPSFVWQNHTRTGNAKKLKEVFRSEIGEKSERSRAKQGKNRGLRDFAASAKSALCCETSSQPQAPLCENFRMKPLLAHKCHLHRAPFRMRNGFLRSHFWHTSAISQHMTPILRLKRCELRNGCEMISKLRNGCEITSKLRNDLQIAKLTCEMEEEESPAPRDHTHQASHSISKLLKPSEPIALVKVPIQPTQEATRDASTPQDLTIT